MATYSIWICLFYFNLMNIINVNFLQIFIKTAFKVIEMKSIEKY